MTMSEDKKFNPLVAGTARKLIADYIKQRRKKVGYSQEQLAEMAQIRKATLVDVEAGKPYNFNTLLAILGCLRGKTLKVCHTTESRLKTNFSPQFLLIKTKQAAIIAEW
jgi:DNA-binding XRE family transcriptional regulator